MKQLIEDMRVQGLTTSDRDFSRRWLGRAGNYVADRNGTMTVSTATRLFIRLKIAGHDDWARRVWNWIIDTERPR